MKKNDSIFGEVIFSYTTREAVEDGLLILVNSKISHEAGIKFPVYISRAVWEKYVKVPISLIGCQDLEGRLWDILWMFKIKASFYVGNLMEFKFINTLPDEGNWSKNETMAEPGNRDQRLVTLKSTITARDIDDPRPAIFIMMPNED